jgi:hypothetical protein
MVKRDVQRRVVSVERRVVRGTSEAIAAVLAAAGGGTGINTADIERLNATFRASLAPLVRRGRAIAHTETLVTAGMWLVGCADNFCWLHESLRVAAPRGAPWKWQERTPAMAAGLTHHRGTMPELLCSQVPLPAWVAPKRRGRPPKRDQQPAMALAVWARLNGALPFQLKDQKIFGFAGLYDTWTDKETGKEIRSYTIITTKPNALVGQFHDRMPVILERADEADWLNPDIVEPERLLALLKPYPAGKMEEWQVSDAARNPKNDYPEVSRPITHETKQ